MCYARHIWWRYRLCNKKNSQRSSGRMSEGRFLWKAERNLLRSRMRLKKHKGLRVFCNVRPPGKEHDGVSYLIYSNTVNIWFDSYIWIYIFIYNLLSWIWGWKITFVQICPKAVSPVAQIFHIEWLCKSFLTPFVLHIIWRFFLLSFGNAVLRL